MGLRRSQVGGAIGGPIAERAQVVEGSILAVDRGPRAFCSLSPARSLPTRGQADPRFGRSADICCTRPMLGPDRALARCHSFDADGVAPFRLDR